MKDNIVVSGKCFDEHKYQSTLQITKLEQLENEFRGQLGETGNKISGGQKQRISIARAIYSNRAVLMLDEATSALDSGIETHIMEKLANKREGKLIIQVTHNKNLINYFDKIIVLDGGRIIFQGDPRDYHE